MNQIMMLSVVVACFLAALTSLPASTDEDKALSSDPCVSCHRRLSPALVMEWEGSRHGRMGVGCADCHGGKEGEVDTWQHGVVWVSTLVTPKDCARCHEREYKEFSVSHHAKAGEILASLDNILAERVSAKPGNIAGAVSGCWQCHGSILKFQRNAKGETLRFRSGRPMMDPTTWPNSGMGRLNPDGSKGSCHACHSRHAFEAKLSRSPENCGKCHMGPDHPHIEIYQESKHGIAFSVNRDKMALDKDSWVLGKDYSAAPTCATCHFASYSTRYGTPQGKARSNSHDVGERISWTLRPVISTKLNLVIYEDGFKEDYPDSKGLPRVGDTVQTAESVVENEKLVTKTVPRRVKEIVTWQERRLDMKGVCRNCHSGTYVDNFYRQYDDLVLLYNEKFARPAQQLMSDLQADGAINPKSPFEHKVQWIFYELWHHEGRRARHGASMMGPDFAYWHGLYEVSKHFYTQFLPAVTETAAKKSPELREKYEKKIAEMLAGEEHLWLKGLKPEGAEALRQMYQERYNQ